MYHSIYEQTKENLFTLVSYTIFTKFTNRRVLIMLTIKESPKALTLSCPSLTFFRHRVIWARGTTQLQDVDARLVVRDGDGVVDGVHEADTWQPQFRHVDVYQVEAFGCIQWRRSGGVGGVDSGWNGVRCRSEICGVRYLCVSYIWFVNEQKLCWLCNEICVWAPLNIYLFH